MVHHAEIFFQNTQNKNVSKNLDFLTCKIQQPFFIFIFLIFAQKKEQY